MYEDKLYSLEEILRENDYPGRGIVCGLNENEELVLLYFIMGRSQNSKNRVFVEEKDALKILPFDESKVEDPSLIIYHPYRKAGNRHIITNGDQTDTIYDFLKENKSTEEALFTRRYEPDEPNFTPRVSVVAEIADGRLRYNMSILKRQRLGHCQRSFYNYRGEKGLGHFIHTYRGNGSPIPSFFGEPALVKIPGSLENFAKDVFDSLSQDKKVALFAKSVSLKDDSEKSLIINIHEVTK